MFIRLPARPTNRVTPVVPNTARPANRETPVVPSTAGSTSRETNSVPNTARSETREAAPPSYTEQVERETTGTPRIERSPAGDESVSEQNSGSHQEDSLSEPGTVVQGNRGLGRSSTSPENMTITETVVIAERNTAGSQNERIALDREIVETIRGIAQEQRNLRTELARGQRNLRTELTQEQRILQSEIQGVRQDTAELRTLVKTHESRLGLVFKRIGDVIDDQWAVREGMDELRKTYEARVTARDLIKSEPISTNNSGDRDSPPAPIAMPRSDIESLYASEEDNREAVPETARQDRRSRETPGEAWVRTRDQPQRFGLGTEEALERWRAASEASRERREARHHRANEPRQQRKSGVRSTQSQGDGGERPRSVTQPHEAGFGRPPNLATPPRNERQPSDQGHQDPGHGSSSSDEPRRGGGRPNRPSRRGSSNPGNSSRAGSRTNRRRSRRRRRRRSPSHSSSSESSDDWDSEFTVLDDGDRRGREEKERRRDPKTEYEREQLKKIRERIRKMVGQDIQYAATYKGVKETVTIKYAGQNDNGMFTRWLDHLLMYFQLNRMCGPDNELVRLSAMYNSLEGVAGEWYRDLILHTPKRSWTFEKAVCSLFLTYVFGSAASHAAREFNEVKYSRTEGAREYAQRLKTKARRLARKPDESTMIVRFLAGLPGDVSRRLTLRERLDPMRHRFKQFVSKLHEMEEAENVTKTVSAAVLDEQRKSSVPGPRRPNRPQPDNRNRPYETQRPPAIQQNRRQDFTERKPEDRLAKGKGPAKEVTCFRCQGKGHYSSDPNCPMYEKNGGPSRQLRDRPQLKAARISDGDDKASTVNGSSGEADGREDWDDGSQWDQATEGEGSLHSHEGDPQMNKVSVENVMSEIEEEDAAYVRAMRDKVVSIQKENPSRAAMNPKIDRPRRSKAYESCLATYVEINGMEAFTLFDSGSSADAISPDFAQVSDTRIHTLDRPVPLQLGTVGSRASINYGVRTSVEFGSRKEEKYYLDVINIDRYDAILGAPFMRRFGIRLDFESNSIIVGDMAIRAFLPEEEATLLKGRKVRPHGGGSRQVR